MSINWKAIGRNLGERLFWAAVTAVIFIVVNPLVKMGSPWTWIHALIFILMRRYIIGRIF